MNIEMPKNEELEARILGSAMADQSAAGLCSTELSDDDFFSAKHKILFESFKALYRGLGPVGFEPIISHLRERNLIKDVTATEVVNIYHLAHSVFDIQEEIAKLKNLSSLRKLIYSSQEMLLNCVKPDASAEKESSEFQNKLFISLGINKRTRKTMRDINKNFKKDRSFSEHIVWLQDCYKKNLPTFEGIPSRYPLLDDTLGYFQNSCLYYIGARTSMGKTTFMLNIIRNMMPYHNIGVFSLEMPSRTIFDKLMCIQSNVKYSKYTKGDITQAQFERLFLDCEDANDYNVFLEDPDSITISNLVLRAKNMKLNHKIDILFIDYLTRITSDTKYPTKHLQVDEISKKLQSLAKSLNIPIICLAQLNRASATNTKPSLADFRESGSIEEDCDAAILLHRPEYYTPGEKPGEVQVIIAKNRVMGTIKKIAFHCDSNLSERYNEKIEINAEIERIRNEPEIDEITRILLKDT